MTTRRTRPLAGLLVLLALAMPGGVAASHVPELEGRVTDLAGVLDDEDRDRAEAAIDDLESDNVQLFALFVDSTDDLSVTAFADAVAAENSLGGNDALLVVAIDDRRDGIWVGDLLTDADDAELDAILAERVEPQLAEGSWGEAVAGAAEGLAEALAGAAPPPAEEPQPQPEPEPAPAGGFPWVLLGLLLLVGGGWLLWSWWRSRRAAGLDEEERDRRVGKLAREANTRLIEVDELIRHDSQELGFVEAQFGKEAATAFRQAIDDAREELGAAFAVRQRLDDATPEQPEEREQMLNEIVQRCRRAEELLAEQTRRFQELRDLERRAPEVLAGQPAAIDAVEARLPEAERMLDALRAEARGSSQAVHGHVAEASKRLELARGTTVEAQAALDRGDRGAAARGAKAAQDAVAQAGGLLDAIATQAAALDEARSGVSSALARARADLETARRAVESMQDEARSSALHEARGKLEAAETAASDRPPDVVLAYRLAREAEAQADELVATVQADEERREKERAAAEAEIRAARLSYDRAADFIGARRHGIGRRPRTRLSEAGQRLSRATDLSDTDPAAATHEARRAVSLAEDAYRLAVEEFELAEGAGYGGTVIVNGRHYPTGRDAPWGGDIGGAILGGIIGSILSGGGRGGFGGGGFGGRGGGGFGGGGGGRSIGRGFGRSGGGRSRGGAW